MENITIKSVTHCPTYGSECKVEGITTHHYIPIKKYTEKDMLKCYQDAVNNVGSYISFMYKKDIKFTSSEEYINSLNKQD